jgi:hypothetical protein
MADMKKRAHKQDEDAFRRFMRKLTAALPSEGVQADPDEARIAELERRVNAIRRGMRRTARRPAAR